MRVAAPVGVDEAAAEELDADSEDEEEPVEDEEAEVEVAEELAEVLVAVMDEVVLHVRETSARCDGLRSGESCTDDEAADERVTEALVAVLAEALVVIPAPAMLQSGSSRQLGKRSSSKGTKGSRAATLTSWGCWSSKRSRWGEQFEQCE